MPKWTFSFDTIFLTKFAFNRFFSDWLVLLTNVVRVCRSADQYSISFLLFLKKLVYFLVVNWLPRSHVVLSRNPKNSHLLRSILELFWCPSFTKFFLKAICCFAYHYRKVRIFSFYLFIKTFSAKTIWFFRTGFYIKFVVGFWHFQFSSEPMQVFHSLFLFSCWAIRFFGLLAGHNLWFQGFPDCI